MVSGSCLCGAVAYEIEAGVSDAWLCHCSKCRRASGAACQAGAVCPRDALRWRRGEDRIAQHRTASGYRRCFCRACGSPVPLFVEGTSLAWVPVACLDDWAGRLGCHVCAASKADWIEIADGLPRFEGLPTAAAPPRRA